VKLRVSRVGLEGSVVWWGVGGDRAYYRDPPDFRFPIWKFLGAGRLRTMCWCSGRLDQRHTATATGWDPPGVIRNRRGGRSGWARSGEFSD
jgi:hypothetical protein